MAIQRQARSTFEIDAMLRRIAQPQLGLITVAQAKSAGVDKFALAGRRDCGALVPVFGEVMRLGSVAPTTEQQILAASLAVPKSAVAATSAAVVHHLPVLAKPGEHDEPIVLVGALRSARTVGVTVVRSSYPLPSNRWHTTRVTTPAATLVQLPRWVDHAVLERCLDHGLAHRMLSVRGVFELIDRLPARAAPGRGVLLQLLGERSSGIGHRSRLEQTVVGWLTGAGLGGWQRNYRVRVSRDRSVEVDFGWLLEKVVLEVSPFFTHGSRAQQERDAQRRRLLVAAGWRVVEATDADLAGRSAFARVVQSLIHLLSRAPGSSGSNQAHAIEKAAG